MINRTFRAIHVKNKTKVSELETDRFLEVTEEVL